MRLVFLILVLLFTLSIPTFTYAQNTTIQSEKYFTAKVVKINEDSQTEINGIKIPFQKVVVKLIDGPDKGREVIIDHGLSYSISSFQKVKANEKVVLSKFSTSSGESLYAIRDQYRLNLVFFITLVFFGLVFIVSGKKGFGSVLGLIFSLVVLVSFIVPQIIAGRDPLLVSIIGSFAILSVSIFFAHGFSKQTAISVVSTFVCLFITGLLSVLFVYLAKLTGLGSEDAYTLQLGTTASINLKGLLLGGIIIGALGVLDDVTTTQSSSVFEIKKANPKLGFLELFKRGFNVGRDHIASVVNTLVLAYAGSSLALFIIFIVNPNNTPLWVILNSQSISEEIIRTLAGSFGLVLAVPITTLLSSWYAARTKVTT